MIKRNFHFNQLQHSFNSSKYLFARTHKINYFSGCTLKEARFKCELKITNEDKCMEDTHFLSFFGFLMCVNLPRPSCITWSYEIIIYCRASISGHPVDEFDSREEIQFKILRTSCLERASVSSEKSIPKGTQRRQKQYSVWRTTQASAVGVPTVSRCTAIVSSESERDRGPVKRRSYSPFVICRSITYRIFKGQAKVLARSVQAERDLR